MKISILGNGSVGRSLATLLAQNGVTVHLGARSHGNHSHPEGVLPCTLEDACAASSIIATALPWSLGGEPISLSVLRSLNLAGKIVIDMTNPLHADWSPLQLGEGNSAGQETARALPGSKVVKAFNTIFADMMNQERIASLPVKPVGFLCGDNPDAKSQVGSLLTAAGFEPLDAGGIEAAFYLEQMAHLNIRFALSRENGTLGAFSYHCADPLT